MAKVEGSNHFIRFQKPPRRTRGGCCYGAGPRVSGDSGGLPLHVVDPVTNCRVMLLLATDWSTISSLVTGAGTLVLAIATFASVRSSNRSARIAEAALQEQRRPVLVPSRLEDPVQKLMFVEGHWVSTAGGRAAVEHVDGRVYLAISLRNVGSGIGVCQG